VILEKANRLGKKADLGAREKKKRGLVAMVLASGNASKGGCSREGGGGGTAKSPSDISPGKKMLGEELFFGNALCRNGRSAGRSKRGNNVVGGSGEWGEKVVARKGLIHCTEKKSLLAGASWRGKVVPRKESFGDGRRGGWCPWTEGVDFSAGGDREGFLRAKREK